MLQNLAEQEYESKLPEPRYRTWPIWGFILAMLLSDLLFYPAMALASLFGRFPPIVGQVTLSAMAGQILLAAVIGGLFGRCWLTGVIAATALAVVAAFNVLMGQSVQYMTVMYLNGVLWMAFAIPIVVLSAAAPLLCGRIVHGWRLVREPNPLTRRRGVGLEELFTVTAAIAAILFLFRVPPMAWDIPSYPYFGTTLSICAVLFAINLIFTLPAVYFAFRIEPWRKRWLSLAALAVGGSLCFGVLSGAFSFASGSLIGMLYPIILAGSYGIPAGLILVSGLEILRSCGIRLARYELEPSLEDESAKRERLAGRRLHRRWVASLFTVAILASLVLMQLDKRRRQVDERNLATLQVLQPKGGSIQIREGSVYQLKLGHESTDRDISEYMHLRDVSELSLADTQITDAGLVQLQQFRNLRSLDLSNTNITDTGLEELKKLTRLTHLSIAGTKVSPKKLPDLLQSLRLRSLNVGNLGLDDQFGSLLRGGPRPPESISLQDNEISDAGLKAFLVHDGELFDRLDFSGTKIDGSGFTNRLYLQELTLDDVPLTDATFGPVLPMLDVRQMLRLRNTGLTDAILPTIAKSTRIRGLELGDGNFTEDGLAGLGNTTVYRLALTGKQFTGRCFQNWRPGIQELDMSGSGITDNTIAYLANLTLFRLKLANTQLTDAAIPTLAKQPYGYLDLSHTKISAKGLLASPLRNHTEIRVALGQFTIEEIRKLKQTMRIVVGKSSTEW